MGSGAIVELSPKSEIELVFQKAASDSEFKPKAVESDVKRYLNLLSSGDSTEIWSVGDEGKGTLSLTFSSKAGEPDAKTKNVPITYKCENADFQFADPVVQMKPKKLSVESGKCNAVYDPRRKGIISYSKEVRISGL